MTERLKQYRHQKDMGNALPSHYHFLTTASLEGDLVARVKEFRGADSLLVRFGHQETQVAFEPFRLSLSRRGGKHSRLCFKKNRCRINGDQSVELHFGLSAAYLIGQFRVRFGGWQCSLKQTDGFG